MSDGAKSRFLRANTRIFGVRALQRPIRVGKLGREAGRGVGVEGLEIFFPPSWIGTDPMPGECEFLRIGQRLHRVRLTRNQSRLKGSVTRFDGETIWIDETGEVRQIVMQIAAIVGVLLKREIRQNTAAAASAAAQPGQGGPGVTVIDDPVRNDARR